MGCGASNAAAPTPGGEGAPTEVPESDVQKLARANRAYNQAVVRKEASEWDAAFRLYEEALTVRIAVCGETSQVVGDTLYHMANARVLQGSRAGKRHT
jgi:CobQ-like glutamine amidotransferase family enzyme